MNEQLAFVRQEVRLILVYICLLLSYLLAVPSKAYFCGRFTAGIRGLNPAEGLDVCLLCWLCRQGPLRWIDHSLRGVPASMRV